MKTNEVLQKAEARVAEVEQKLADLDKLASQELGLIQSIADLRLDEQIILASESKQRVNKLLEVRAKLDCAQSDLVKLKSDYLTARSVVIESAKLANDQIRAFRDERLTEAKAATRAVLEQVFDGKVIDLLSVYFNYSRPVKQLAYQDYFFIASKPDENLAAARKLRGALEHYKNPKAIHEKAEAYKAPIAELAEAPAGQSLGSM
jgi:hypothetical protein